MRKTDRGCLGLGVALACAAAFSAALPGAWAGRALPEGFVYLRDVDPSIAQDMRYAGADNFMGRPAPGYGAAECVLAAEAARALGRVQRALRAQGLSLKVYDCYRPARAVRAFVAWANARAPDPRKTAYHPRLAKPELLAREYIAAPSGHSLGTAVDLTLIRAGENAAPASADAGAGAPRGAGAARGAGAPRGPCTAPQARRGADASLDMGTSFDCFDPLSHTANPAITGEPRKWRTTLLEAMGAHGFGNYAKEWWHFSLPLPGYDSHRDFPIPPRRSPE